MTICFTLPYSSGGCEERRIKFDLLTAIIKCSLLAPIKGRGLMLTWLTLMQPRRASALPFFFLSFFSLHQLHFVTLTCECVRVTHRVRYGNAWVLVAHYLFCMHADGKKGNEKKISFFGYKTSSACGKGQIYGEVVEFTILPALALSAFFLFASTVTLLQ